MTQMHEASLHDALRARIRARRGAIVGLLGDLVAARSENPPGDERAAVAVVESALAAAGIASRRLAACNARPNLVAAAGSQHGRTLMLSAHVDTVPAAAGWTRDPYTLCAEGDRLYGLGAADNKGAVAAMTVAFLTLIELGALGRGRVLLIVTADEEDGSRFGMDHVRDVLDEPIDAAIIGEPSGIESDFEKLWVGARATYRFEIKTIGTPGHTSLADRDGVVNAAGRLLDLVPRFERALFADGLQGSLVPVGLDSGGRWGFVPGTASAKFDLRLDPGPMHSEVAARVSSALEVAAAAAGARAVCVTPGGSMEWVSSSSVAEQEPIVEAVRAAWRATLSEEPSLGCFPGGTDARALSERGIPAIPGLGPGALKCAHAPDEFVSATALVSACEMYAHATLAYLQGGSS
jgi:acetylornithine deacetylase/succinyl-diaminopimelate desuccinylase-like protein